MKSKPDPPVFRQPGRYSLQKELLLEQEFSTVKMPNGHSSDFCVFFVLYWNHKKRRRLTICMALALSKEQLAKLNKKDILQLLLESMEQEKELRSQLAVLTDELKRTNQQMQVILEKWNLAQATRFGRSSEKMTYDTGACQQLEPAIMYAECFNEAEACFLRQILLITPSFAYNRIQYE